MDVRSFKLTTGEELIAELVKSTGRGYEIKNPLVVHMMRTPEGAANLGLAQWSMLHKPNIIIEILEHGVVATPIEVHGEIESTYIQNTTGLLIPPPTTPGRILHG